MEEKTNNVPTRLEQILSLPNIKPIYSVSLTNLSPEDRRAVTKHWERYNFEFWYSSIEDFTFKSRFFPLSKEVAEIISKGCYRNLDEVITQPAIVQLENAIDESIASLMSDISPKKPGVFIRLSTRSPKDATLMDDDRTYQYIVIPLADRVKDWKDMNLVNRLVWSGLANSMKAESGKDAVRFLLQSDRAKVDCGRELDRGDEYNMNIIIREWVDIPIAYEFRCFITNKKINAITQYFDNCFFEEVALNKEKLLSIIQSLWESVKDKLPFEDGIVDFAISQDLEKAYVIECNPLDQFTGSALFNYFEDWEVITGRKEFEFRIIESTSPLEERYEGVLSTWSGEIKKAKHIQLQRKEEELQKAKKDNEICLVM